METHKQIKESKKLFRRFLIFSQFLTAISPKLWRHLATKNENYLVRLNGQSLLKKTLRH